MIIPHWKTPALKDRDAAQMLQQRHVDIQRLWKRLPPQPQAFTGRPGAQYAELGAMTLTNIISGYPNGPSPLGNWLMAAPPAQAAIPTGGSGDTQAPAGIDFGDGEPSVGAWNFSEGRSQFEFRRFRLIVLYLYRSSGTITDWNWMPYVFSGAWSGRIALIVTGNSNLPNYLESRRYYNANWAPTTGITVGGGAGGTTCTLDCSGANGVPTGGTALMAGVSGNLRTICPWKLSGGTSVAQANGFDYIQQSTVTFSGTGRVSFVVIGDDGLVSCDSAVAANADGQFLQNLWSVEV